MNSSDQLLLSKGVCRQLGKIKYHFEVFSGKNRYKSKVKTQPLVPVVRVSLVKTVSLLPHQSVTAQVKCEKCPYMVEPLTV